MKKTWVKILVPILVLSLVFAGVHLAVTGNNKASETTYTYAVEDGKAILTGSADALQGAVMLPAEIGGYPVAGIGDSAFKGCADVTAFFLPDSITSIGSYAFEDCASLKQAILPEGLVSIGEGAFWECASLVSVTIPISVTEIGSCAFYKCDSLKSLVVPGAETPVQGIFNVALDIGQTLAIGNPARAVLDPVVTTVYCYIGSTAYADVIQDQYCDYVLLSDGDLTSYTVRFVDENDEALAPEITVSLQPIGIEVAAVAAAVDTDEALYPEEAVQTRTLTAGDNILTFVYPAPVPTTTEESTTEEPTTEESTTEEPTTEESTTEEPTTEESTTEEPTTEEPTTEESTTEEPTTDESTTEESTTEESTTEEPTTEESTTEEPTTEPVKEPIVLIAREGSGAVIDRENGYIYGLEEDMSFETLTRKYLTVSGEGRIECSKVYQLGTGTQIRVIDNETGDVLETWTLILFGDLDGDGLIRAEDVIQLKSLVSGAFSAQEHPEMAFAADMDNDGLVRMEDRPTMMGIISGAIRHFDQATRTVI